MGCGSTNEIKTEPVEIKNEIKKEPAEINDEIRNESVEIKDEIKKEPVEIIDEINNKPVEIKDEITEPRNYYYCLKEREISYIEELKEKKDKDIKNGKEKGGDNFYPLFRKIDLDLTTKETIIKEYLVFYIPSNYSKSTLIYQGTPPFEYIAEHLEEIDPNEYPKYAKINNSPKAIKRFECKQNPSDEYTSIISNFEFEISESDKENNLITLETGYKIELIDEYGFYRLRFYCKNDEKPLNKTSFMFTIDNNYVTDDIYKDDFDEISKYKLYSFNREDVSLSLRDKRIKINIEDELAPKLLCNFSDEEIKQINFSLNTIEYKYDFRYLIYHKVIHNIKNNKDYIKIYYVEFYPHNPNRGASYGIPLDTSPQPIIIKKLKINNLLVKKEKKVKEKDKFSIEKGEENVSEDEPDEANEEGIEMFGDGYEYYVSGHNKMGFYLTTTNIWSIYEFECESNENLDYFQLICNSFGHIDENVIYGSSYKYEIILNGHNIKFSNPDFKYSIKNDKIILEGFVDGNKDNFDEKKYNELAEKENLKRYYNEQPQDRKIKFWAKLRLKEFLPEKMKLVKKLNKYKKN